MQMLYNSENFAVVQFGDLADASDTPQPLTRGGFEIVDKNARREIYIEGVVADSFKRGVEELVATSPSEEDLDEYVSRYAALAQQPVVLH
jgi:Protein of unknown function (DUF3567)